FGVGLSGSLVTLLPQARAQLPGRTAGQGDPSASTRMIVPLTRSSRTPYKSSLPTKRYRRGDDEDASATAGSPALPPRSPAFSKTETKKPEAEVATTTVPSESGQ